MAKETKKAKNAPEEGARKEENVSYGYVVGLWNDGMSLARAKTSGKEAVMTQSALDVEEMSLKELLILRNNLILATRLIDDKCIEKAYNMSPDPKEQDPVLN